MVILPVGQRVSLLATLILASNEAYCQVTPLELPDFNAASVEIKIQAYNVQTGEKYGQPNRYKGEWGPDYKRIADDVTSKGVTFYAGKDWQAHESANNASVNFSSKRNDVLGSRLPGVTSVLSGRPSLPLGSYQGLFPSNRLKLAGGQSLLATLNSSGEISTITVSSNDGDSEGVWRYEGRVSVGGGRWIPRESSFSPKGLKKMVSYHIVAASFGVIKARPYLSWFKPGIAVSDERVNPAVSWTYPELIAVSGRESNITPEELLTFSKAKAKSLTSKVASISRQGQPSTRGEHQWWKGPLYTFAAVALFGFCWFLVKKKLSNS